MTLRVTCSQCGAQILPATAAKNRGLCVPCKSGYRSQIEAGKKRRDREREYERSAGRKYWLALLDRIHRTSQGLASLSQPEKTYYAVSCLVGEVYNGGFDQFFSNSSGALYGLALDGLFELRAEQSAALLVQAKELLFGDGPVPSDRAERLRLMPTVGNDSHPAWQRLDSLDRAFWDDPDQLAEKCTAYANRHHLYDDS